jgi:hypothetical protein
MKYLKYFESSDGKSVNDYLQTELTVDEIKEMFLEISDMDWTVQVEKSVYAEERQVFFIVRIFKIESSRELNKEREEEIKNLIRSDIYRETIEIANERLSEFGWYIDMSTLRSLFTKITFNIYKYEDKKI